MGQDYTDGGGTSLDDVSADDLPNALIVTSLDICVFNSPEEKEQFEAIFKEIDNSVTFQYFKSFKRARVNFSSPLTAAKARIECHQRKFGNSVINCYFAQVVEVVGTSSYNRLCPPAPSRQFLISPPASPPVGWEPREEAEPIINYDLITAITHLTPGETHEIHPPSQELPAIVVHVCEDVSLPEEEEVNLSSDEGGTPGKPRMKIQQTRRPPVRSSSEGSEDSCDSLSLTQ
ncbi:calcipressin-2-like [Panonychus citri]|uniref:calcipressin-2-like n=1 Tax=Panonychus citri TaxID=50023 RepID=UPI0023078025|nr:calcipressin-2-like [Panonychus citri]